jgi:hypothetical protein
MAQSAIVSVRNLDTGLVLTPERYDPRRFVEARRGTALRELVNLRKESVSPNRPRGHTKYAVLDTNDAKEGFLTLGKALCEPSELGSTKKIVKLGDVIISRLRPYLRQVGLAEGPDEFNRPDVTVVCSTEFYVLYRKDIDIAGLMPFLLSEPVQTAICAAQEGGHHPRFDIDTLLNLRVPDVELESCAETGANVRRAAIEFANAYQTIRELVKRTSANLVP